jgi:hypothetical protein
MSKKFIVTTSIYEPSEATLKYAEMEDWTLIVVGDKKTPHESYKKINCIYLDPEWQEKEFPELSDAIGWNCVMRRNLGFVEAYRRGADIVATVDDDNIPYWDWDCSDIASDVMRRTMDVYSNDNGIFDPLSVTNYPQLWHRGYPLELAFDNQTIAYKGKITKKPKIQAGLWDGDPDVDAVCRKLYNPKDIKLTIDATYTTTDYAPFNSQNTFLLREILPYYMVLPHVGRMDDIWGGYICQYLTGERPVFTEASVFQKRNEQSIKKNLEDEVLGYTTTLEFVQNIENFEWYLPERTLKAFNLYRKAYE